MSHDQAGRRPSATFRALRAALRAERDAADLRGYFGGREHIEAHEAAMKQTDRLIRDLAKQQREEWSNHA